MPESLDSLAYIRQQSRHTMSKARRVRPQLRNSTEQVIYIHMMMKQPGAARSLTVFETCGVTRAFFGPFPVLFDLGQRLGRSAHFLR